MHVNLDNHVKLPLLHRDLEVAGCLIIESFQILSPAMKRPKGKPQQKLRIVSIQQKSSHELISSPRACCKLLCRQSHVFGIDGNSIKKARLIMPCRIMSAVSMKMWGELTIMSTKLADYKRNHHLKRSHNSRHARHTSDAMCSSSSWGFCEPFVYSEWVHKLATQDSPHCILREMISGLRMIHNYAEHGCLLEPYSNNSILYS